MSDEKGNDDPTNVLPVEVAREHLVHWWREPVAGAISVAVGCFDTWVYGRDAGLTTSLDELLIVSGVILIAGTRKLFGLPTREGSNGGPK